MPRYQVEIKQITTYTVEVEADNYYNSEALSLETQKEPPLDAERKFEATVLNQIGEPWVLGGGYLTRPDGYCNTKDLLVFKRSFGNVFSKPEVDALIVRSEEHVGPVRDHWNGVGHSTLSIKLRGDFEPLTDEQVEALLAPLG